MREKIIEILEKNIYFTEDKHGYKIVGVKKSADDILPFIEKRDEYGKALEKLIKMLHEPNWKYLPKGNWEKCRELRQKISELKKEIK